MIITRANDRRLRPTATDWVKNGDRWTITHVGKHDDLAVRHNRSQLAVRLPIDYVRTSTGLAYATTIHTAQGVTADTMHGLATGQESRQQLYTMLTAAGTLTTSTFKSSATATRTPSSDPTPFHRARPPRRCNSSLAAIRLRSPPAPCCASSTAQRPGFSRRSSATPTVSGSQPNASFGPETVAELDQADQYLPGLTNEPAWPTLRANLLGLAAKPVNPPC